MATRYDIITSRKTINPLTLDVFVDGLRHGITKSPKKCRAVFIDNYDVIHAMSWGSEFNRLCESANLVGIYHHDFSADELREDLNITLGGG